MIDMAVNLAGVALIGFIVWWFWLSRPQTVTVSSGPVEIVVDNGVYTPSHIEAAAGQPLTLRFIRRDPSPCAEKVIFSDLDVSQDLAVGEPTTVIVDPRQPGEYAFTCQMGMYRGTLKVT